VTLSADVKAFITDHESHGELTGDASDVTPRGYRLWLTCPCGSRSSGGSFRTLPPKIRAAGRCDSYPGRRSLHQPAVEFASACSGRDVTRGAPGGHGIRWTLYGLLRAGRLARQGDWLISFLRNVLSEPLRALGVELQ
jgi:hypothetical protein